MKQAKEITEIRQGVYIYLILYKSNIYCVARF